MCTRELKMFVHLNYAHPTEFNFVTHATDNFVPDRIKI